MDDLDKLLEELKEKSRKETLTQEDLRDFRRARLEMMQELIKLKLELLRHAEEKL